MNWLTVERALYGVCLVTAAALRLHHLGADPLDRREAAIAWPAWMDAMTGGPPLPAAEPPTSALLFSLDWLVFWLAGGGNDAMARWPAAAIGTGLVLLPWALRPILGRTSALVAAGILAIDPLLVSLSREVNGAVVSAFCGLLALVAFSRSGARGQAAPGQPRRRLLEVVPAIALGLLLVSGTEAWSFALLLAAVGVAFNAVGEPTRHRSRSWAPLAAGDSVARPVGIVLATALVAATAGLAQWQGPLSVSASLTAWIRNWRGPRDGVAVLADLIAALATSQPLLLTLPLLGLLSAWPTLDRTSGRRARGVVLPVLSAMLLAVGQAGSVTGRLPLVLALVLVAALAGGPLAARTIALLQSGQTRRTVLGWAVVLAMGLLVLVTIRGSVIGHWNQDLAHWQEAAPPGVRLLARDVASLCAGRTELRACLIDVVASPWPDPLLAWYLRELAGARWVLSPSFERDGSAPPVIIAPVDTGARDRRAAVLGLPDRYAGARYRMDGTAQGDGAIVLWVPRE